MTGTTFLRCYLALSIILACSSSSSSVISCGNLQNIHCPFSLKGDNNPQNCLFDPFELSCENNQTILYLNSSMRFYVKDISYENRTFRLVDPGLQKDNCSSMPQYSLRYEDVLGFEYSYLGVSKWVYYINCSTIVVDSPHYLSASTCIAETTTTTSVKANNTAYNLYVVVDPVISDYNKSSCHVIRRTLISKDKDTYASFSDVHNEMVKGFDLGWDFWYSMSGTINTVYGYHSWPAVSGLCFLLGHIMNM